MMTTFLRNKGNKAKKPVFWGILVVLFLILISAGQTRKFISRPVVLVFHPFLTAGNFLIESADKNFSLLKHKKSLEEENIILREKIKEMDVRQFSCVIAEKENREFKKDLLHTDKNQYISAYVFSGPPRAPYDILIIGAGFDDGIRNGMEVTAYGSVLLGHIVEVFPKTSKVKLSSFPGEENNVLISSLNLPIIAFGKGGENFESRIPRSLEIKAGEKITTIGPNSFLLGIAEKIEIESTDPFQNVLFRIPINIQELKYVMVKI